ncbi:MAG: ATP-binding protein [Bryobacteraceae bacterium]
MSPTTGPRRARLAYENRLALLAFAAGLPAVAAALWLLWHGDYADRVRWTLGGIVVVVWLGATFVLRERLIRPLQTLANLLAALGEGDYSVRAHSSHQGDALDEVYREVNTLSETLHSQRMGAVEASALLRTVMAEIDVAVFTFDDQRRLRLVNRAAERLLDIPGDKMLGQSAEELGLAALLDGPQHHTTIERSFPGGSGRWGIRLSSFREGGMPHRLLVIEDLTRALREEQLLAWKRLVRVIGHELNNSLAPIRSIAGSLSTLIGREPLPGDWREDAQRGLGVIGGRAESLSRFMDAYARLAKLPPPVMGAVDVAAWIKRVTALETRVKLEVDAGPALEIKGDNDQLDQLLINLVRNAADAALETKGGVWVRWRKTGSWLEVMVIDDGLGLANTANLFVPFFTTKPGGSGIGLVLCRQIAEAHRGEITLRNRPGGKGCEAVLRLPV